MRFKTTPLGIICVYIGGLVAGAAFDSINLFLAMIVTFFIGGGSMTFNDYYDWKIDKVNHPERPIPRGIVTPNEMLYFTIFLFILGLIISYFINLLCLILVIISIIFLVIYERYTKNISLIGNINVGFVSALSFTFGGAAVGDPFSSLLLSIMAFLIMVSREIIMDIRDCEGDEPYRNTLPMKIGKKPALHVATIFLLIAVVVSPIPYFLYILNEWYLIAIVPVNIITLYSVFNSYVDIKNVAKAASLMRIALAIGLVAFVIGALL
jgi:geranylgeranylglycerol-phosphate geranylgeranyltransferase